MKKKFSFYVLGFLRKLTYILIALIGSVRLSIKERRSGSANVDVLFLIFYKGGCRRYVQLRRDLDTLEQKTACSESPAIGFLKAFQCALTFSRYDVSPLVWVLNYHVRIFRPRMIVISDDGFPYVAYKFLRERSIVVVNLAHGITGTSELFCSMHYDYYFVFGKSSYKNLRHNRHARGSSKIIISGSPFFQRKSLISRRESSVTVITIVGAYFHSSFSKERWSDFEKFYKVLGQFISNHPDVHFIYKPHIIRHVDLEALLLVHPNVEERNCSMHELACLSNLGIMSYSVSSVEFAAAKTPFLIYEWDCDSDAVAKSREFLRDTEFFERATDLVSLERYAMYRIRSMKFLGEKLEQFFHKHVERDDSIEFITRALNGILNSGRWDC